MKRLALSLLALGLLGGQAFAADLKADAEKYLQQLSSSKDPKEKIAALKGLGEIGAIRITYVRPAVPEVFKLLEDSDAKVRGAAAEALGKLDPDLDKALPALSKLLKDNDDAVKMSAAKGLASMGSRAKPALKDLQAAMKKAMDDDNNRLRGAMRNAIRTISGR